VKDYYWRDVDNNTYIYSVENVIVKKGGRYVAYYVSLNLADDYYLADDCSFSVTGAADSETVSGRAYINGVYSYSSRLELLFPTAE